MKSMLYGALCSTFVFAVLSWATTKKNVRAAVLTAPPAGRFQIAQLHASKDSQWSGILDTETGCTWAYTSSDPDDPRITDPGAKAYLKAIGRDFFSVVIFDTAEYIMLTVDSGGEPDWNNHINESLKEIERVRRACSRTRLQALKAAGAE